MGKRIGSKRLNALNKESETRTTTAGVAMDSKRGSQSRSKKGEIITTEVTNE